MRKLRSRIAIFLAALVLCSCAATLLLSFVANDEPMLDRETAHMFFMGPAVRDLLLVLATVSVLVLLITLIARGTTDPIRTISNAASEIARGNYDVQVSLRQDRVEEYGELQRNFNAMARELKKNEDLRQDFISNVSHELKTPLAIIEGYAALLRDETLSPAQRGEYAAAIEKESARLSNMTENMLRLSRMDEGRQKMEVTRFCLDEQIRRCVIELEPQWSAKDLEPVVTLESIMISGDEALLGQVWRNLLDNAVKFSNDGGKFGVTAKLDGGAAVVCVFDEGSGMDVQTRNHMFDRFYQGDSSHKKSGSGLGLSIVRRIVALHGGRIAVNSAPNAGTRVTVTIPGASADDQTN